MKMDIGYMIQEWVLINYRINKKDENLTERIRLINKYYQNYELCSGFFI